jgi:hypothetical protein
MQEIEFLNEPYGCKAVLRSNTTPEIVSHLRERSVTGLELNVSKGWRGNLKFLSDIPSLKELAVIQIGGGEIDLSPIQELTSLTHLSLSTYSKNNIDFRRFPNLLDCSLEWQPGFSSIFGVSGLKRLFLSGYSPASSEEFANLKDLEELSIKNTGIKSLFGISQLHGLRRLTLGLAKNLDSLAGVERLSQLVELEINTCKKLSSIEPISSLKRLRILLIVEFGDIASLKPIEGLTDLSKVMFYGSTNFLDGDLSPLTRLPAPLEVSFKNRKHYSMKREDFAN